MNDALIGADSEASASLNVPNLILGRNVVKDSNRQHEFYEA